MQGDMPATRLQRAGPAPEGFRGPEPTRNCILFKFQVALPRPYQKVTVVCGAGIGRPQGGTRGNRPTPGPMEIIAAGPRRCTALLPAEPEPEPGPNPVRPPQLTWSCPTRARSRGSCPVARASANLRLALAQLRLGLCEP